MENIGWNFFMGFMVVWGFCGGVERVKKISKEYRFLMKRLIILEIPLLLICIVITYALLLGRFLEVGSFEPWSFTVGSLIGAIVYVYRVDDALIGWIGSKLRRNRSPEN